MVNDIREEEYTLKVGIDDETNLPRWQTIRLGKKFHSPPDGRPSHIAFDDLGRAFEFTWHHFNMPHRENGPSRLRINPDNGIHVEEEFSNVFAEDLADDVVFIERDEVTGNVIKKLRNCDLETFSLVDPAKPNLK